MRRIRALRSLLPVLLAAAPALPLAAQGEGSATEGAPFLLLPVGARAVAMGRAVTALAGPESVFWNPAGLGELTDGRIVLYRVEDVIGENTAASGLFSQPGIGAVGVTYDLLDVGEQDLRDAEGNVLGSISYRNHLGIVSVATRFWDRVNLGFNFKIIQFRESCRGQCLGAGVAATTYAVDGGAQLTRFAGLPLRLGAMVAHAGPRYQIRNEEQADPMPIRVRVAAAYEVLSGLFPTQQLSLWITGEVDDRWRDPGSPSLYVGSEFTARVEEADLVVRSGYVIEGEQLDGAAVGVAIRYSRFDLGIAKSLASNLAQDTEPVHVTFGFVL